VTAIGGGESCGVLAKLRPWSTLQMRLEQSQGEWKALVKAALSRFEFDRDSIVGLIVSIRDRTDLSRVGCRGAVQCVEVKVLLVQGGTLDIKPTSVEMQSR